MVSAQPVPTSPPAVRNTLCCQEPGCHTPLATIDRQGVVSPLVPNSTSSRRETRVPCPTCGQVRVIQHR